VRDRGIGFNVEQAMMGTRSRYSKHAERLKLVDGELSIGSQAQKEPKFMPLSLLFLRSKPAGAEELKYAQFLCRSRSSTLVRTRRINGCYCLSHR